MSLSWSASIKPIIGAYGATISPTGSTDDGYYPVALLDPFHVNGSSYSTVYAVTNTYLTWGASTNAWLSLSNSNPPQPTMFFGAGDHSCGLFTSGRVGDATFMHYEGSSTTSTSGPAVIIEWYFWAGDKMQVVIGTHNALGSLWGISDGVGNWLSSFSSFSNTSYTFETADNGLTWLVQNGSFIDSAAGSASSGKLALTLPYGGSTPFRIQNQVSGSSAVCQKFLSYNTWNNNIENAYTAGYSGGYKLTGRTIAGVTPYAAHVLVFPKNNPSLCIASAHTDNVTGTFTFTNIAAGPYLIVAIDTTGTYRMVNYSLVAAVPM